MIQDTIVARFTEAFKAVFEADVELNVNAVQTTRKDFEGDYTVNVFPFLKQSRKSPEETGEALGEYLQEHMDEIVAYNVIKGFLNLVIADHFWINFLNKEADNLQFGKALPPAVAQDPVVIEYSSPNTNKPLHLGHIRNNLLGWSVAEILKANGRKVEKVNLVNDRGIHICKTMIAYKKWGNEVTPEVKGEKGDKLVGEFYVMFDKALKKEVQELVKGGMDEEEAAKKASLMVEAHEMLKRWEAGDEDTRRLWERMNTWVYDGFANTYQRLGVDFQKIYYESDTYLLGREIVLEGLDNGVLFKKEDGSTWADLSDEGLDEKLLLRADGTSVYMTQDLGTAQLRYDDYHPDRLLYVVGNEQNYHFDVLRRVLRKLGRQWAENIVHISYGMVELPGGKMKSREGKVVDADDLLDEMYDTAKKITSELGKVEDFEGPEASQLFNMVGLGALKYFILKVDPRKNMLFNPEESVDFSGNTGPFIQYTYARIQSLLRKAQSAEGKALSAKRLALSNLGPVEKDILKHLYSYPSVVKEAGASYSPALIANYVYELAREYNQFYQEMPVIRETEPQVKLFRLLMSEFTGRIIKRGMRLLGIDVPERM